MRICQRAIEQRWTAFWIRPLSFWKTHKICNFVCHYFLKIYIYYCSSVLSAFPFHLRFSFVQIFIRCAFQFAFYLSSHSKSIAPVTFKPMERKSEPKMDENWNETETQMARERWKTAGTTVLIIFFS